MKYSMLLVALLSVTSIVAVETQPTEVALPEIETITETETEAVMFQPTQEVAVNVANMQDDSLLTNTADLRLSVTGQGVAPMNTNSPAQAYALAKRAAIADGYRMIAERVKGVRVEGQDLIKNMMVKRTSVRTSVQAMVRNANIVETTFKEGLCEVEMEIVLSHSQFPR